MALGGHALVAVLAAAGIRRFYTVPGESFLEVLDGVAADPRLTLVSTRHESGASFAAEADARTTGIPAVAMATRGVGAANLAIGVHSAQQSSTPLIALVGHVETQHLHKEAFQEVDLTAFYGPITKWTATVPRPDRVMDMAAHAVHVATSGRPGPVMLALPSDILGEQVETADPESYLRLRHRPRPQPSAEEAEALAAALNGADRPVVVAGGGAREARAELVAVAEAFSAGVYTGFRRQDHFPNDHPLYLGTLGLAAAPGTLAALEGADVVLVVGSRLDEPSTHGYRLPPRSARVLQIDIEPASLGAVARLERGVIADAREALRMLVPLARPVERDWSAQHGIWARSTRFQGSRAETGMDPAEVAATLAEMMPADTIVTNDAGNFAAFVHRYWRFTGQSTQLGPISGAMGYAVPAALGAKLAAPERTVVATAGDGGFLMSGQEIETSVRLGAPFIAVVFRNGLYGTIAMHEARAHGHTAGCGIGHVDIRGFARSVGADGVTVTGPAQLEGALREALDAPSTFVVDVATDPDLINPAERLSDLRAQGAS